MSSYSRNAELARTAMDNEAFEQAPSAAVALSYEEKQFVIDIIDSSLRVYKRYQFFAWAQGMLQSLVPHEILVCGVSAGSEQGMRMLRFSSSRYFNDDHFAAVCEPENGLMRQMMGRWEAVGQPCLVGQSGVNAAGESAWLEVLNRHEMRNAAAHGMRASDGTIKSYFCFARVPEPFAERLVYVLHILMPFLDSTLSRVLAQEEREGSRIARTRVITSRETQILRWIKDGHTNIEIANILSISPHTVKNHVRKILLKLGVQTRGQAALKAIQLGVLKIRRE